MDTLHQYQMGNTTYPSPLQAKIASRQALNDVINQFRSAGVAIHWPPLVTICSVIESMPS